MTSINYAKLCAFSICTLSLGTLFVTPALAATAKAKPAAQTESSKSPQIKVTAVKPLKFHFENAELKDLIAAYAKASGQKFVIDPSVKGKASILNTKDTTLPEAFALLSSALAVNGYAISEQGDTMVVQSARNVQRSLIPLYKELPELKPERMVSVIFELKFANADDINKHLRILPSKDGELVPYPPANKIIITDWVSNIHRVATIIADLDQPAAGTAPDAKAWKASAKPEPTLSAKPDSGGN